PGVPRAGRGAPPPRRGGRRGVARRVRGDLLAPADAARVRLCARGGGAVPRRRCCGGAVGRALPRARCPRLGAGQRGARGGAGDLRLSEVNLPKAMSRASIPPKAAPKRRILPIAERLHADTAYAGRGVTIAFLDAGFYAHPDLCGPRDRIRAY